jgi:hypothetical protein
LQDKVDTIRLLVIGISAHQKLELHSYQETRLASSTRHFLSHNIKVDHQPVLLLFAGQSGHHQAAGDWHQHAPEAGELHP